MKFLKKTYVSVAYTHAATDARVRRHCETMARRGWRVYQLGIGHSSGSGPRHLNGVIYLGFQGRRYRGTSLLRYLWAYGTFFVWAWGVIRRIGQRHCIRVVHANNIPNFIVLVAGAARRSGAAIILDIHDPVPELFACKFASLPGRTFGVRWLVREERLSANFADVVLCVHEPHRSLCERHGIERHKLRVVLNSADESLFPMRSPRAPTPFIVYHGTVTARMGLDVVLKGLALVRTRGIDARGAIWGDGDVVAQLRQLKNRLGLAEVVQIPGTRAQLDQLAPRLNTVGIAIVPMFRDTFTDYLLPTKLIEAVRLGIPCVVTWTPTVARYFPENTVHYVHDFTPQGVASTLENVLRHPEDARERVARAQALPVAMSWQQVEQDFVQIIEGASQSGAGAPAGRRPLVHQAK